MTTTYLRPSHAKNLLLRAEALLVLGHAVDGTSAGVDAWQREVTYVRTTAAYARRGMECDVELDPVLLLRRIYEALSATRHPSTHAHPPVAAAARWARDARQVQDEITALIGPAPVPVAPVPPEDPLTLALADARTLLLTVLDEATSRLDAPDSQWEADVRDRIDALLPADIYGESR